jgi:TolB-like protein
LNSISKNNSVTIAVLPFKVIGASERLNSLILGFNEDLITNFSKFVGLSVISRFSTSHIKDNTNQKEIDNLGTDFLIMGSVRLIHDDFRLSIQLVKTDDKAVVFAEQYNESLTSLLEIQDKLIHQIVSVLQQEINYTLLSYSYKKNTVNLEAYENYLIGMDYLKKGSLENDIEARKYFESALKIDDYYALAYTGMSLSYFNEWSCRLWDRWDISKKGAHKYALKAIEIDKNDYSALAVLGRTYLYQEEFEKAEHCVRKSLRMNSNDAANLILISFTMCYLGYFKEALDIYLRATELNPKHKERYYPYGVMYYFELGNFNKCLELFRKTDIRNNWTDYPAFISAVCYHLGDYDKMWEYWKIYLELFKERIYNGPDDIEKACIEWCKTINPYKEKTNFTPYWDYISEKKGILSGQRIKSVHVTSESSFVRKEETWELIFKGRAITLKDAKGLHDIAKLLQEPNKQLHCMDLMGAAVDESNPTTAIDRKAKSSYVKRIKELQIEIEDAEATNNNIEIQKLHEEYDSILEHLSQSMGLAGKSRKVGSTIEKARTAVTWRIRSTIKKIDKSHPDLAKHLSKSIRTGTFCTYNPEQQPDWLF